MICQKFVRASRYTNLTEGKQRLSFPSEAMKPVPLLGRFGRVELVA